MNNPNTSTETINAIYQIGSTVLSGKKRTEKLNWITNFLQMSVALLIDALNVFDKPTVDEIKGKLKAANHSKDVDKLIRDWDPHEEWDVLLKILIDLIMRLLHTLSPPDPEPIPPAPDPDTDMAAFTEDFITNTIVDPEKKDKARKIHSVLTAAVKSFTAKPPASIEEARAILRTKMNYALPDASQEWLELSEFIADALIELDNLQNGLTIPELLARWLQVAEGARRAS